MKIHSHIVSLLWLLILGVGSGLGAASDAWSQDKHSVSYTASPGSTRYIQEHLIDVGDVPGHQVRVFELHEDFSSVGLAFNGVKVSESSTRGISDYTNGNGIANNYTVYMLEDGNKVFGKASVLAQSATNPDGSKIVRFTVVTTLTGGTGDFRGIRGILRTLGERVPGASTLSLKVNGEYWMEQ